MPTTPARRPRRTSRTSALRRSELAEVEARDYLAMQEKSRAERELAGLSQSQLSRTREQLAAASERQTRTEQQLAQERAASERARQMLEKLGAVKQERGMVITLPGGILFQTAQTTVLPGAQDKLTVVAQAIKEADRDVLIEGHTDSQGSVEMNMKLSESRAESVRDYLVSQGAPVNRIRTAGVGESRPMADNSTAEGRAQNRRVEIIVAPFESKTERKPRPSTSSSLSTERLMHLVETTHNRRREQHNRCIFGLMEIE